MKALKLATSIFAGLAMLASLNAFAHDPVYGKEKRNLLQEHELTNAPGKKALMLTVEYAPGQATMPHMHQGSVMAYVLEGEITSQVNDEKAITYKAGESWYEAAGSKHLVSANASATKPAKLLVFILKGDKDEVLTPLKK